LTDLERMTAAAKGALIHVLELTADDNVLVVGDDSAGSCPDAFAAAASELGCEVDVFRLPEENRPLKEMPDGMLSMLDGRTAVINAIAGLSDEVPFRLQWLKAVEDLDLRLGHSPGICDAMMLDGPLDVDYGEMLERARRVTAALAGADSVRIASTLGSDIVLRIAERPVVNDVCVTETEKGVNLPCGEVYCCPVETEGAGTLVVDGCFGGDGNVPTPVTITVADGRVVDVESDDSDLTARVNELMDTDDGSRSVCELGIGLNPGARLVGNMLEDEKALRTLHVAFGGNQGMPGGANTSKMHMDYLVHRPDLWAVFEDGRETTVLRDGDIVV